MLWNEQRQSAFDQIKHALSTAPVLAHPDFSRPFKLYTNASLYALRVVLTQEFPEGERVIQWPIIEREAW